MHLTKTKNKWHVHYKNAVAKVKQPIVDSKLTKSDIKGKVPKLVGM